MFVYAVLRLFGHFDQRVQFQKYLEKLYVFTIVTFLIEA